MHFFVFFVSLCEILRLLGGMCAARRLCRFARLCVFEGVCAARRWRRQSRIKGSTSRRLFWLRCGRW